MTRAEKKPLANSRMRLILWNWPKWKENSVDSVKIEKNVEKSIAARKNEPGFWREIWQQVQLVYYLLRDPEVPFYLKIIPFTALVYLVMPLDLIPDPALLIGQLDDLTVLFVAGKMFVQMAPQHVVAKHIEAIRQKDGYITAVTESSKNNQNGSVEDAIIIDGEHEVVVNKK